MAKPQEKAVLTVNGQRFEDWETVMVKHSLYIPPFYSYKFTCSEGQPLASRFAAQRIKPGDECTVTLAGILAISGRVVTRQVYYDKQRHIVEIQGANYAFEASNASIQHQTGEWKNKTLRQIFQEILGQQGLTLQTQGDSSALDKKKDVIRKRPGEKIQEFMERHLRGTGGAQTSDVGGHEITVVFGPDGGSDAVVEGRNILIGREVIDNQGMASSIPTLAQGVGTDDKHGPKVTHQPYGEGQGSQSFSQPSHVLNEHQTSENDDLKSRGGSESTIMNRDMVFVTIDVQGWLRPSGGLWRRSQTVHVTSPMLIMDDDLILRSVTFTQSDAGGTRSTLDLVNQNALGSFPQL